MPHAVGTSPGPALDAWPSVALLDALPDAVAVLDRAGTIVAVNHAWRMFTRDNGGDPARTGAGTNYLEVCARAATAGCQDAGTVGAGLRAVLAGYTVECDLEYACPSPSHGRWFVLRVTPIVGPQPGALVSHLNITRQKLAEQSLQHKASEDPLTELANRTLLNQRLSAALTPRPDRAPTADVGILYIDLNRFKQVNDSYGHAAGDEVLQTVAFRLTHATRPQDTVARLGGDEFAVLAPRITFTGLVGLAERIGVELKRPHLVHGRPVEVGASVGTYLAAPGDAATDALDSADRAMYVVKRASRSDPTRPGDPAVG